MSAKRWTVAGTVMVVLVMAGLVVASVPLYRLACRALGIGGATRVAVQAPGAEAATIIVRFDGTVSKGLPWRFVPDEREKVVHLGERTLATFTATNTSADEVTGTATFNVTPDKAGRYFDKIQCFCFTEQRLAPGQTVEMGVEFFVDPAIAADPYTQEIGTLTLSYTFFRKERS